MIVPFLKAITGVAALDRVQSSLEATLRSITSCPLLHGAEVGPLTFTSGVVTLVDHKLGRVPRGWFLVSPEAAVTVSLTQAAAPTSKQLTLVSSAHLTASLYVY